MKEKKIINEYKLLVYDTGEVKLVKEEKEEVDDKELVRCSSSIRQIIKVINYVVDSPKKNPYFSVNEGIKRVAEQEGICLSSVHSKITRKFGLSMWDFKRLLEEYLNDENKELEKYLYLACVQKNKVFDQIAVKNLLEKINKKINEWCKFFDMFEEIKEINK